MPRNGSGTYTLPEAAFVPNTTISSTAVNDDFSDIATAITGSIAADGQTLITGQLKGSIGSAASPSFSFSSDLTSGVFLSSSGVLGLSAGSTFGLLIDNEGSTASSATVSAGGTGYVVGDTITLSGGTYVRAAVLQVATLSGSAVSSVTVLDAGLYSTVPANPVAQASTSGVGASATFSVTWGTSSLVTDLAGAALWTKFGATSYMAGLMSTVSAAALNTAIRGTDLTPANITTNQNDYAPTGFAAAATLRLNPTSDVQITGISNTGIIDQQQLTINNINASHVITIVGNSASSTAGNRFLIEGASLILNPGSSIVIQYDSTSTGWRVISTIPNFPIQAVFKNLSVKVATNTTVAVAADYVVMFDGFNYRTAPISATGNLATNGTVNALDTGSIASNTFYAVWAISNGVTDGTLFSTSFTSPTMPTGYTFKARIGAVRTASAVAQLMGTWQFGRRTQYVVGLAQTTTIPKLTDSSGGATSGNISVVGFVPTTASEVYITINSAGGNILAYVAPNSNYGIPGSATNPPPLSVGIGTGAIGAATASLILEATTVFWAATGTQCGLYCSGWVDNI